VKNKELQRLSLTAMFTAVICAATMVIQIPTPTGGYVNAGDAFVLLAAVLMGPWVGMIAGGIGSALSDLLAGYMLWVPATLVIKGLMGFIAGLVFKRTKRIIWAGIPAECVMVLGYFAFEAILVGQGLGAAAGIPGNVMQAVFGLAAAVVLVRTLSRNRYLQELFPVLK